MVCVRDIIPFALTQYPAGANLGAVTQCALLGSLLLIGAIQCALSLSVCRFAKNAITTPTNKPKLGKHTPVDKES